jgi:hypothetical protein
MLASRLEVQLFGAAMFAMVWWCQPRLRFVWRARGRLLAAGLRIDAIRRLVETNFPSGSGKIGFNLMAS